MSVSVSVSEVDVVRAMGDFLMKVLPAGVQVFAAQDNAVPMARGPFVTMTQAGMRRLGTTVAAYDGAADEKTASASTEFAIQLDFYGVGSGDMAATVQTLFMDAYAFDTFPPTVKPLYVDDPVQLPLITGEQQFEQRWKLRAVVQYAPVVAVPQQFADQLHVDLIDVDATFPP
jgi:hypothetical protein